ncbi:carbohydrate-binding domain-containing protein, partial [Candidatus Dojkabacteria bacterium]|nr:carbohydrate-binding domain-containing protein [Candidatus Dojkabacteria bacterium]
TDVAIDGKDYVVIKDGIIDIVTLRHGIRSNNNTTPLMGSIFVENGGIKIISEKHSLSANTNVVIEGGQLDLTAGGGSYAHVNRNNTSKGIRSSMDIFINGGEITINSGADGIHAKNNIEINEGKISIKAGDDAITSLSTITVNNGDIDISDCYEGLEAGEIIINNGQIYIHSRDDGLNTVIKNKDVDLPLSIYGIKKLPTIDKTNIEINGGYIFINSQGDGIDANGPIIMHDGTLIIHGPDSFLESAVDYLDSFEILNGFLVAIGPKVLAQVPSSEHPDSQVSIHIIFNSVVTTGTLFSIQDEEKNSLITIKSLKPFESILFSSPELKINKRYPVLLGGEVEGRIKDTMFYNISKFTRIETRKNFQITEKLTTIDFNNN